MGFKKFLYGEIANRITLDYRNSDRLPGERALAERYHCTRTTVRTALEELQTAGKLRKLPRSGNRLLHTSSQPEPPVSLRKTRHILLIVDSNCIQDPGFMDMVAGALECAEKSGMLLTLKMVPPPQESDRLGSLDELHPGIAADGYVIASPVPAKILHLLQYCPQPCVFMGDYPESLRLMSKTHFYHCYLHENEKYETGLRRLLDLGHRRILTVEMQKQRPMIEKLYAEYGLDPENCTNIPIPFPVEIAFRSISREKLEEIVDAARRHTALIVPFGNRFGFEIYHRLLCAGFRIPDDLSVIYSSGKTDHFVPIYRISTLYSSAWDEGTACIREVVHQIQNGETRSGTRYTEYQFLDYGSLAPPKKTESR